MYFAIEEDNGYIIVDADKEYFAYTDTEEKADMMVTLLNNSLTDFQAGRYEVV